MAVVTVKVGGRDYQLACDDGQEEQLRMMADEIDDRVRSITFNMNTKPPEGMTLLMAALTMADELAENKKEIEYLQRLADQARRESPDHRAHEMEAAMAVTLEEIALRIEKIADQIEH